MRGYTAHWLTVPSAIISEAATLVEVKHAELVLKATKVDGVYSADPMKVPDAVKYERLTYDEVAAMLVEGEPELHRQAGRALMNLGEAARGTWLAVLDHPDSHIRWHAARGLGQIGLVGRVGRRFVFNQG